MPRSGKRVYEGKNDNDTPLLLYAAPYFARLGNPMQDCHQRKEPALRSMLWGQWSEEEHGGRRFLDSASLRSKWQFDTWRSVIAFIKTKSSLKRSCFPPQRNPVPFHPLCPMSSVSAWSTAAAVRGTTARARHESPVISATIDVKSWISLSFFQFTLFSYHFPEMVREKSG